MKWRIKEGRRDPDCFQYFGLMPTHDTTNTQCLALYQPISGLVTFIHLFCICLRFSLSLINISVKSDAGEGTVNAPYVAGQYTVRYMMVGNGGLKCVYCCPTVVTVHPIVMPTYNYYMPLGYQQPPVQSLYFSTAPLPNYPQGAAEPSQQHPQAQQQQQASPFLPPPSAVYSAYPTPVHPAYPGAYPSATYPAAAMAHPTAAAANPAVFPGGGYPPAAYPAAYPAAATYPGAYQLSPYPIAAVPGAAGAAAAVSAVPSDSSTSTTTTTTTALPHSNNNNNNTSNQL